MLSISTCWNSGRHTDGEAMLQELLDLGFERVELGHGIRLSLMEGVQKMFARRQSAVFFAAQFLPAADRDHARLAGLLQILLARRARARAGGAALLPDDRLRRAARSAQFVVLHLGRTPIDDYTDKLIRMAEVGLHQLARLREGKARVRAQARGQVAAAISRARIDCLKRIADYAGRERHHARRREPAQLRGDPERARDARRARGSSTCRTSATGTTSATCR